MTRKEMLERLEAGEDPISISIQKWKDIVNETGIDVREDNCALCEASVICGRCVIFQHTGVAHCIGTPYIIWFKHMRYCHYDVCVSTDQLLIHCDKCRQLALNMLEYLENIKKEWYCEIRENNGVGKRYKGWRYLRINE